MWVKAFLSAPPVRLRFWPIAAKASGPSFICSTDCATLNRQPVNTRECIHREMYGELQGAGAVVESDLEKLQESIPIRGAARDGKSQDAKRAHQWNSGCNVRANMARRVSRGREREKTRDFISKQRPLPPVQC